VRTQLAGDDVAARLVAEDPTLWGPRGRARGLGPARLAGPAGDLAALVARLAELRAELQFEGLDRVVLCGVGGSSLAPEVVCRTAGAPLVVLDTTDPHQVAAAMTDLDRTVVVLSAESGGTVETDSQRRAFIQAFADAGLDEKQIGARFVVVTDPGSPLAETGAAMAPARCSSPTRTSAAATARCRRSAWSRRRWPGPTSAHCSRRPPSSPSTLPSPATPRSSWAWP
jgi:glucose-6-phosphate isomerase